MDSQDACGSRALASVLFEDHLQQRWFNDLQECLVKVFARFALGQLFIGPAFDEIDQRCVGGFVGVETSGLDG